MNRNIRSHDKERGQTMKINEPKTPYVDSLSDVCIFEDILFRFQEDLKEIGEEIKDPMDNVTKENTIVS